MKSVYSWDSLEVFRLVSYIRGFAPGSVIYYHSYNTFYSGLVKLDLVSSYKTKLSLSVIVKPASFHGPIPQDYSVI